MALDEGSLITRERPGYRYVGLRDGASKAVVTCPACGRVNHFWMWSWAGNGSCRCKGCRAKLRYATAEVIPEEGRRRG